MSILYKDDITGMVFDKDINTFEITIKARSAWDKVVDEMTFNHVEQAVAEVFLERIRILAADLKKAVK